MDVGPGSYLLDKVEVAKLERFKPLKHPIKESNWDALPRFTEQKKMTSDNLGPGAYREINKWNKRTYNLKFLNNQTQAPTQAQTPVPTLKEQSSPTADIPGSKQIKLDY